MNFLTPAMHPMFDSFYKKFDDIFTEQSQRTNFRLYGTGLLLEIKRKNIWYISEHIIDANYQSMHHFVGDSPWDEVAFNCRRIRILENNRSTRSCEDGYVIIDDTGNQALEKLEQKESEKSFLSPKSGDSTHATRRQWIGSLGKVDSGQVVVTSHYVDSRKDWPIDHRPYMPRKWVQEQNELHGKDYVFKSKLELGLELLDQLKQQSIRFSHMLVDGWYGNSPDFIKGVESREFLYITSLYANRRVYFRLSGEKNREEHSVKDVVTTLEGDAFSETQYTKANGEKRTVYVADISLKVKNLPGKRRMLIVKPTPQETDMHNIDVLMSNDTLSDVPFILHSWSFRDSVDKFYLRGKDDLGFDQYQVRDDKPIRRHWYMVFFMYSFIIWHRQCGSFRKWCTHVCCTFNQLLDVIRTKLMLHFHRWCMDNPEHWHEFLQDEKGIPMAAILA